MGKSDIWALFNHPPAPTYYKRRFALLGDAAHATTPHQGSGAGLSVEDAFILSNLLGQAKTAGDIERAFHAYDAVRRPRSQNLVRTSHEQGRLYDFEVADKADDIALLKQDLENRMSWIWDIDFQQHLAEAMEIMGVKAKL